MSAQPIDIRSHKLACQANNGGRRRRYATDQAKRQWYARSRQERFAHRLAQ